MKVIKSIRYQTKPLSAAGLLCLDAYVIACGGLIFGLLYPQAGEVASAETQTASIDTNTPMATAMNIDSTISVTAPESVVIDATPGLGQNNFHTGTAEVRVSSNNISGYTLSLATTKKLTNGNNTAALVNNYSEEYRIETLNNSTSVENFPNNTWGFTTNFNGANRGTGEIPDGTYLPLTAAPTSTLIKTSDTQGSEESIDVTFGIKVNDDTASGVYENTVLFSAVATVPPPTLDNIETMQEMTTDICSNTPTYEVSGRTYGLEDERDGKVYAVRKLLDGNCWMVQNLALGVAKKITSADSDVSADYNMPQTSVTHVNWQNEGAIENQDMVESGDANKGNYYSWYVATAGSGTLDLTTHSAEHSICPKGWRLSGGIDDKFSALLSAYPSKAVFDTVWGTIYAGQYGSKGWEAEGSETWLSSTPSLTNRTGAYMMYSQQNGVHGMATNNFKCAIRSVRCVAR